MLIVYYNLEILCLKIFYLVIFFVTLNMAATVRGQIVDEVGVPLQNASAFLIGTNQGTYSDKLTVILL